MQCCFSIVWLNYVHMKSKTGQTVNSSNITLHVGEMEKHMLALKKDAVKSPTVSVKSTVYKHYSLNAQAH